MLECWWSRVRITPAPFHTMYFNKYTKVKNVPSMINRAILSLVFNWSSYKLVLGLFELYDLDSIASAKFKLLLIEVNIRGINIGMKFLILFIMFPYLLLHFSYAFYVYYFKQTVFFLLYFPCVPFLFLFCFCYLFFLLFLLCSSCV